MKNLKFLIILFFILAVFSFPSKLLKSQFDQTGEKSINIERDKFNILCVNTVGYINWNGIQEDLKKNLRTGPYLVFSGKDGKETDGGCKFTKGVNDSDTIWVDFVYVELGKFYHVDINDLKFEENKIYGQDCQKIKITLGYDSTSYLNVSVNCSEKYLEGVSRDIDVKNFYESLQNYLQLSNAANYWEKTLGVQIQQSPKVGEGTVIGEPCPQLNLFQTIWAGITGDTKAIVCAIAKVGFGLASAIIQVFSFLILNILKLIIGILTQFQMAFNNILAGVLNVVARLNPFDKDIGVIVWRTFRDLAYIVLIFSALYAGFIWIFEGKGSAFSLIFNIILIALIINFSYAFVKLIFTISFQIENGLSGGLKENFGTFIVSALSQGNYLASWQSVLNKFNITNPDTITLGGNNLSGDQEISMLYNIYIQRTVNFIRDALLKTLGGIAVALMPFIIALLISGALGAMIFLFFIRFIKIIFLLITSSLAVLSLAYPNKGPLGKYLPQFPFAFDNWFSDVIKWAVVIPIFMFMIVLGVVFQQNFADLSKNNDVNIEDYIFVFIFLLAWFILSFNVASSVSKEVSQIAKGAAGFPTWILGKIGGAIAQRVGVARVFGTGIKKIGKYIEDKVSEAPVIKQISGWQLKGFARSLQKAGDKVREKDYWVINKQFVMEEIKNSWKNFVRQPNTNNWDSFLGKFGKIAKEEEYKEDVEKFLSSLRSRDWAIVMQYDTNNNFFKLGPVKNQADKELHGLSTFLTATNVRDQDVSFNNFLRENSYGTLVTILENINQNVWNNKILPLMNRNAAEIINDLDVLPKLVSIAIRLPQPQKIWLYDWLSRQDENRIRETLRASAKNNQGDLIFDVLREQMGQGGAPAAGPTSQDEPAGGQRGA